MDPDYPKKRGKKDASTKPPVYPLPPEIVPFVQRDGCTVYTINKTVSVYDANGKLLKQESITDYTKENVRGECATLDAFIRKWTTADKKRVIADALKEQGIDLDKLKADMNMEGVDDFDLLCHIAYDQKPLTRRERAENVKKRDFLHRYSGAAREVLELLLDKYMNEGIQEIEETAVLKMDDFRKYGTPAAIIKDCFGGKESYKAALKALEEEIYKAG